MNIFERSLQRSLRFRLRLQIVSAVVMALGFGFYNSQYSFAALYGGVVSISGTLLLIWHSLRALKLDSKETGDNLRVLYRCAFERIVLVVVLLALGLGLINLEPLALIASFVVGQVVYVFGGLKAQQ